MTRWVRRPRIHWRRTTRHVVVLAADEEQVLVLDGSGLLVWDLLAEPLDVDDTAAVIADLSGADPEQVRRDIAALVERLVADDVVMVAR